MTLTIPAGKHITLTNQEGEPVGSAVITDDNQYISSVSGVQLGIPTVSEEDGSASYYHPFMVGGVRELLARVTGATVEPELPDEDEEEAPPDD